MIGLLKYHCIKINVPRAEQIEADLIEKDVSVFFPIKWERVMVGREISWKTRPRLGQYAFVQIDHDPSMIAKAMPGAYIAQQLGVVKSVRGVMDVLCDREGRPEPIRAIQIEAIRRDMVNERAAQKKPASKRKEDGGFQSGSWVLIKKGPFEGCSGKFVMYEGQGMALLEVQLFGQATAVHIADCDIEAVSESEGRRRA